MYISSNLNEYIKCVDVRIVYHPILYEQNGIHLATMHMHHCSENVTASTLMVMKNTLVPLNMASMFTQVIYRTSHCIVPTIFQIGYYEYFLFSFIKTLTIENIVYRSIRFVYSIHPCIVENVHDIIETPWDVYAQYVYLLYFNHEYSQVIQATSMKGNIWFINRGAYVPIHVT